MTNSIDNKKAEAQTFWIMLIIAAIVTIIFMFFLGVFREEGLIITNDQKCQRSIDANIAGHIRGITIDNEIECEPNLEPIKTTDEHEKKKQTAEKMKQCFGKFKEGKEELFTSNTIYCSICDMFEYQDHKNIEGFQKYLLTEKIPEKDQTYMAYLSGYKTEKAGELLNKIGSQNVKAFEDSILDGKKKYAVIFVYAKGKDEIEKAVKHITGQTTEGKIGLIAGTGVGVAAGISTGIAVMAIGSNPVGWAIGAGVITFGAIEGATFFLSSDNKPEWASFVILKEYNAQSLKELNCKEIK